MAFLQTFNMAISGKTLTGRVVNFIALTSLLFSCYGITPFVAWSEPAGETASAGVKIQAGVEVMEDKYIVGPGDILSYSIFRQTEFGQADILVRSDGNASFNGIGELPVGGKTVQEITRMVENAVEEYVVEPRATISITKTRPATAYLSGAVLRPGMVQLSTSQSTNSTSATAGVSRYDFRVANILANSGGVQMNADLSKVEIRRADNTGVRTVNLWKVLKGESSAEDAWVQSGDTIYVPKLESAVMSDEDYNLLLRSSVGPTVFPVRLIGEVGKPGIIELNGQSPYLNSALAQAGGYKTEANKKLVAIRRFTSEDKFSTFYVDPNKLDITLRPNDVVYVSPQRIAKSGQFMDHVTKTMSPFTSVSNSIFSLGFLLKN